MKGLSDDCAEQCLYAESVVFVENAVFARDERVNHVLGKLVDADNLALFFACKLGDELAVDVENARWKRGIEFGEVFIVDYVFCI